MEKSSRSEVWPEIKELIEVLKQEEEIAREPNVYVKPQFAPLTQEEIDDIHKRGFITQEEACKEWKEMSLCAPGNAGINPRCKQFDNNCDDCSIDYSLSSKEHISVMSMAHGISSSEINELISVLSAVDEKGYEKVIK